MSRTSSKRTEARRQARMRHRAKIRFHVLNDGRRSFHEILERIRRRWPTSCSGDGFAAELRRLYDAEQAEREIWLRELARRLFARWHHPRWSLERLMVYIRRRRPKLAKNPIFVAELQRCFDAAHAPDLQPSDIGPRPTPAAPGRTRTGQRDQDIGPRPDALNERIGDVLPTGGAVRELANVPPRGTK